MVQLAKSKSHPSLEERIQIFRWETIYHTLDNQGFAILNSLLNPDECFQLIQVYDSEDSFRSKINMERYRFGKGEYKYFTYPLPTLVQTLRDRLYPHLSPLANRWNEALNNPFRFPNTHSGYLELCYQNGQQRPTPLLLKYKAEDYNCLHQDLYGEMVFPLQVAIALSQPNLDYTGGEFILVEQKPRAQSRAHAITLNQGDAIIFAVHHRPVQGTRGFYRVNLKHGVSTIQAGQRYCLGIIFHDAK